MVGPKQAGSAYVLLHHIMGEAAGRKGVWAYIEGKPSTEPRGIAVFFHAQVILVLAS